MLGTPNVVTSCSRDSFKVESVYEGRRNKGTLEVLKFEHYLVELNQNVSNM